MRRFALLILGLLLLSPGALAQSNVDILFFACETQAVIDLSGTMDPGFDLYYQVFRNAGATGEQLTPLRRVPVDGDYAVSDRVNYSGEATLGFSQIASVSVGIAREGNPDSTTFETVVDDLQDGCAEPTNPLVGSVEAQQQGAESGEEVVHSGILTPDGGFLNPRVVRDPADEPIVQIGARESDIERLEPEGRTANPGLIFAECQENPEADPGIIYDTDPILVFWSWFAKTPQQVRDHIEHAQYDVKLNGQIFPRVDVSPVVQRQGLYWVFYTVNLGDAWEPGTYGISFNITWDEPISDGFEEFGPGTDNERYSSGCEFQVQPNPWGIDVVHQNPSIPLRQP